jgi:hypothetical protein
MVCLIRHPSGRRRASLVISAARAGAAFAPGSAGRSGRGRAREQAGEQCFESWTGFEGDIGGHLGLVDHPPVGPVAGCLQHRQVRVHVPGEAIEEAVPTADFGRPPSITDSSSIRGLWLRPKAALGLGSARYFTNLFKGAA